MTDLQLLFAILALLYLWECACWVRKGSVAFRTWWGLRWRIRHPGTLLGNQRGGFVFAPPLPPLGTILTGTQFPFSISPQGLLAFMPSSANPGGRPPQSGRFIGWGDARQVESAGKRVLINGENFFNAGSPTLARFLTAELEQIRKTAERAREASIASLIRRMMDCSAVKERIETFEKRTRWIPILTNALFVYLFCIAPVLISRVGFGAVWPALLTALLACTISLALLFRRAHRILYPAAEDERFTHFLIVLLSPATAIRALDLLSRPLLENFHPVAVAKALCPEAQFRSYARLVLREIRYPALPLCPSADAAAGAAERHWRAAMNSELERFLKKNGVDPKELLEMPQPNDAACVAYCPRCESQYTTSEGVCDDCGGLKLVALALPAAERK